MVIQDHVGIVVDTQSSHVGLKVFRLNQLPCDIRRLHTRLFHVQQLSSINVLPEKDIKLAMAVKLLPLALTQQTVGYNPR